MEVSLPGRFSFQPLTRDGRRGCRVWILPAVVDSSGVSEFLRLVVEVRGRFWPVVDLGCFWAFEAGAVDFWGFLGGASGGHSTSWVRSKRSTGTYSELRVTMKTDRYKGKGLCYTVKTLIEFLVVNTSPKVREIRRTY